MSADMAEHLVHSFPHVSVGELELRRLPEPPTARKPLYAYALVRVGIVGQEVVMGYLTRDDLGQLGENIVRELLGDPS